MLLFCPINVLNVLLLKYFSAETINYFIWPLIQIGLVVTLVALTIFGAIKGRVSQTGAGRSAWQTLLIGGLAAAAAFGLASALPKGT